MNDDRTGRLLEEIRDLLRQQVAGAQEALRNQEGAIRNQQDAIRFQQQVAKRISFVIAAVVVVLLLLVGWLMLAFMMN